MSDFAKVTVGCARAESETMAFKSHYPYSTPKRSVIQNFTLRLAHTLVPAEKDIKKAYFLAF
jgi:hypothetical protein